MSVTLQFAAFALAAFALPADPRDPTVTPSPVLIEKSRTLDRRGVLDDVESYGNSILSGLGSDLPSWVASGVPAYFQGLPAGDKVVSSLGIQSSELAALPTQALYVPPYGNYTSQGWQVRVHGNIYKQPNTSIETLNKLANVFLVDTDIEKLPQSQQEQARNLTVRRQTQVPARIAKMFRRKYLWFSKVMLRSRQSSLSHRTRKVEVVSLVAVMPFLPAVERRPSTWYTTQPSRATLTSSSR